VLSQMSYIPACGSNPTASYSNNDARSPGSPPNLFGGVGQRISHRVRPGAAGGRAGLESLKSGKDKAEDPGI